MQLTPYHKRVLDDLVESIEIDVEELESATWNSNPYMLEPQLAGGSGCWDYDEDEYFERQIDKAIEYIKADGISAYFPESGWGDGSDDKELLDAAIEYLQSKLD